jgi:hypothetical protein
VATIIAVTDLPAALQSAELVDAMVAGANAKASRVAPCLIAPTTDWAATTAYTVGQTVKLSGGEALVVSTAGTSDASEPVAPELGATVTDGTVVWTRIAPTVDQQAEAKLVLLGAIKRWAEAGSGALQTEAAGPFSIGLDTRQRTGYNLWPSEITDLQAICKAGTDTGRQAFSIDTAPACSDHLPWCSLMMGATYCSCGVDIAGEPIYELY